MDRTRAATLLGIAAIVVATASLRGFVAASGWFYWDDLILQGFAAEHDLPGSGLFLHSHDGHFMPGGMLLAWLSAHLAPLGYWMLVVQMVVLQLAASSALAWLLWVITRGSPLLLIPLVWASATPLQLPASTWWAAAINSQPLIIAMAWAAAAAVLLARYGRRRHAVSGVAAVVFGLLFIEKAVIVPFFALLVVLGWWYVAHRPTGGTTPGSAGEAAGGPLTLRALARRTAGLWIGALVSVALWAVSYVLVVGDPSTDAAFRIDTGEGAAGFLALLDHTYRLAVLPTLAGGPWEWERWHPSPPWASPPPGAVLFGAAVLAFALWWSLRTRRRTAGIWVVALAYPAVSTVAVAAVRLGTDTATEIVQTLRYHDDVAVVLAVAVCLAISAEYRGGGAVLPGTQEPPGVATARATAVALVGLIVLSSAVSTVTYRSAWAEQPSRDYFEPVLEGLAARDAPVFDQDVPLEVLLPVTRPANELGYLTRRVDGIAEVGEWTTDPVVITPDGQFLEAEIGEGRDIVPGPEEGCGHRIAPEGTRVGLDGPLMGRDWIVALNYFASGEGEVELRLDEGDPVSVPVNEGLGSVYVRLVGSGDGITVTPGDNVGDLCVGSGPVGVLLLE